MTFNEDHSGKNRLMGIVFKMKRVYRISRKFGLLNALRIEYGITIRKDIVKIEHKDLGPPLFVRATGSDVAAFEDIFFGGEYDIQGLPKPSSILDAGANVGLASRFFLLKYPEASLVAVEPSPENRKLLERNLSGFQQVTIVDCAVWSEDCFVLIENPDEEGWSHRCIRTDSQSGDSIKATTIDSLSKMIGLDSFDLIKLDIEGAEEELFSNPGPWIHSFKYILMETHSDEGLAAIKQTCADLGLTVQKHQDMWIVSRCS